MRKETGFVGRLFLSLLLFAALASFAAAPVANNDSYITKEDTSLSVPAPGVLGNDTDSDGNALRALLVSAPAHGTVVLNTNGSFVYSPETGFIGADTFTYRAVDTTGATSSVAAVILKVQPVRTNCVSEALPNPAYGATGGGHAIWLPGIGTNFVFTPTPGTFVQFGDGTAILSGTVFSKTNLQNGFVVDVRLSGFQTNPPPGSPKKDLSPSAYSNNGGPIDTARWVYYTNFTGTLTGLSNYAGAVLTIVRTGPSFQVGFGASGKNLNFGASAWFNWTVVQQPTNAIRLTTTGLGDFNLDLFKCDDGGEQCVTNAVPNPTYATSTRSHAIYLPGIATDLIFRPAGRFIQNADGTATITGLASSRTNSRNAFQVNVQLSGYTTNVSLGSPKKDLISSAYVENGGPVDPSTWSYYTTVRGTFTGVSNYAGAVLTIARTGPAFQIGIGANGKNLHFGASGWFTWTVEHQPNSGSMPSGQGDFNLDIVDCPAALALLCPATIGEAFFPFSSALAVSGGTPPFTFSIVSGSLPTGLALNLTNGIISGTPTVVGAFDFVARVTDVTGASALGVCSSGCPSSNACRITIVSSNRPPVAGDDEYKTSADTPLSIPAPGVLTNDFDPDGDLLTMIALTFPAHGTMRVPFPGDGSFGYIPDAGFSGFDVFTYVASDGITTSAVARVTIEVNPARIIVIKPPANQTNCPGETATFNVIVTGTAPTYQWLHGTNILAGQTNSILVLANVGPADAGMYCVIIRGADPVAVTNCALLVINQNVIVTVPPTNQTVCSNSTVVFQVSASGTALTYQWYFATNALAGQTNSALVLSNVTAAQAGTYRVIVSGACGAPVTNSATLTVSQNVFVTFPPASRNVCANGDAVFQVTASGAGLTFQWYFGGTALGGQTNSILVLTNVTLGQSGIYQVVVSGACGVPVTNSATLTVNENLIVTTPPANQTVCPNGTATFRIVASGSALTYRWFFETNALAGQTNSILVLSNVTAAQAGIYRVAVFNGSCGGPAMNSATLTVSENVIVTVPPANQTVCSNETAIFQVTANGGGLSYQWYFGAAPLAGQTGSTLVLRNVTPSQAGTYRVVVSGACGVPVTNSAALIVNLNLIVTSPPANQTVCPNGRAVFQVIASGTGLTYQWYFGTNALLSQTNNVLLIDPVTANQAGTYRVIVNGPCGGPVTNSASLTVSENIVVTEPPANQTVCSNETAFFLVGATGAGLSYQWYFGAVPIAGQTGNILILSNVVPAQAGTYRVVVSGDCGAPVTNSATLTVNLNLIVTTPPANQTVCASSNVVFQVSAIGTALTYQWYFGTNALAGETSITLMLNNVTAAQAGTYRVVVNGPCGGPVTNSATLTVNENVVVTRPLANLTACPNETKIFAILASGSALTYQWYFGTNLLVGETGSTLTLSNVTAAQAGTYRVVVRGACGPSVTNSATLTVNQNVIVVSPPANQSVCSNSNAIFQVTATGTALSYQWYFGGATLGGQTNNSLVLSNVTTAQAGTYVVVVSGACGAPVTNSATLTVNESVIVTVPPANQEACIGESATFSVTATGAALTYQWYRGILAPTLLPGQTNSTLVLTNVSVVDAGLYTVVVRGTCGGPVTNSATLFVNFNVFVVTPPSNQTSVVGGSAVFTVIASGSDLRFQWFFNGTVVGTNATLTLSNLTATQAGTYCVVVSGICGPRTTNCATLTLLNRPPIALDDAYTTPEDVPLVVAAPGVLVNDSDPDGDAITAMLVSNPTNGTVVLNPNGSFLYIPFTNFTGLDAFTYKANDGIASSPPATVRIKVDPSPDCPIARDDNYTTRQNTTLAVPLPGVLANDSDPDDDVLTAVLVTGTTNGTVALLPNGSFIYVPNTNFLGVDHFTYRARDASCDSGVALVTITVTEGLLPPIVSIVSPTNGATFVAPAAFSVIADATDIDGVVTNVQIFAGTNRIGIFTNVPYLVPLTNLPAGTYTFIATATDNDALSATSSPVTVTVTSSSPVTALGPIVLNRQTGLFEQFVRVSNPTPQDFLNGVRVFVQLAPGDTNDIFVWNATGTNANGIPFVDTSTPLLSGGTVDLLIQYFIPVDRVVPTVTLTAVPLPFGPGPLPASRVTSVTQTSGMVTVEFTTAPRCLYYLQCSDDLIHWTTIPGVVRGTGGLKRCTDAGGVPRRFYRTIVVR